MTQTQLQTISRISRQASPADDTQARCSSCGMRKLCLPMGLSEHDTEQLDRIIARRRIPRGDSLYRMHQPFVSLYAIRVGHFKISQINVSGEQQVTGFQMAGELLGMDAISTARHHCDATALENSEVCEIPFHSLEELLVQMPPLLRHFHRVMSQEITREQSAMVLLGSMRAEQKFAAFLVNLSSRYDARGYSPTRFELRMSREDIGNYLGLTGESISRLVSSFKNHALISVSNREIVLLQPPALKALAVGDAGFP